MAFWNFHPPRFGWTNPNNANRQQQQQASQSHRDSGAGAAGAGPMQRLQLAQQQLLHRQQHQQQAAAASAAAVAPGAPPPQRRRRQPRHGRLRSPSDTQQQQQTAPPAPPSVDVRGDRMRARLADEVDDRFARLRSNQALAPYTRRTGPVHFDAIPSLMDEREAAEKALVDRYVRILETAVKQGIQELEAIGCEHEMLRDLRLWKERVKQETIDNADLRAYLLARRESLCGIHATLSTALAEVKSAQDRVVGPRCPPAHPPAPLPRALHG